MTLLETLVVILIAAVLLGLGITGLTALRNRLAIRNASSELVQNINTVRNDARNSVLVGKQPNNDLANIEAADKLDYYVIKFSQLNYTRGICDENINLECTFDDRAMKGLAFDIVEVIPEGPATGGGSADDCTALVIFLTTGKFQFGRLNGDGKTATVTTNNIESCNYRLEHRLTRITRARIQITSGTGEVKII